MSGIPIRRGGDVRWYTVLGNVAKKISFAAKDKDLIRNLCIYLGKRDRIPKIAEFVPYYPKYADSIKPYRSKFEKICKSI